MSTSSAPAATASFTSASLTARLARPLGNAVATLATCTPLPLSSAAATWARSGYTQTAATMGAVGSAGSGRLALAHSARTRLEEHTSELQSLRHLVCRLLLE